MRASHFNDRMERDLEWRDIDAWPGAFLLLQFERCQPFLADAGVPLPMVADSRDFRDAARRFVRGNAAVFAASQEEADRILEEASKTGQTDYSKPAWQRRSEARTQAILRGRAALAHEALARLVEVYGEEEARLLHEWAQHQFASWSPSRWQAWCVLLPTLAGVSDQRPPDVASPLAPEAWRRFATTVSRRFNRATVVHDTRRLRTAFRSPMSAEDQELERRHPYHSKPTWGALARAQYAVGRERAYQVWKELDTALDAEEREAVLRWGRDEALARNMYEYLPALHDHMGVVARYACPCCGYYTFHKWPPGMESSFDICPVCFWEDDAVATRMPTFVGSSRVSLEQARENFRAFGAVRERLTEYVRPPRDDELPQVQA